MAARSQLTRREEGTQTPPKTKENTEIIQKGHNNKGSSTQVDDFEKEISMIKSLSYRDVKHSDQMLKC